MSARLRCLRASAFAEEVHTKLWSEALLNPTLFKLIFIWFLILKSHCKFPSSSVDHTSRRQLCFQIQFGLSKVLLREMERSTGEVCHRMYNFLE